jgi:flagellar biosynthesis/type III secretory pathway chaperone
MNPDPACADHLEELRQLLLEERGCIRELDMERLAELQEQKKELLPVIEKQRNVAPELEEAARSIRFENRRNAYLLKFSLNWVRSCMELFGQTRQPAAYDRDGGRVLLHAAGGLLSGKV